MWIRPVVQEMLGYVRKLLGFFLVTVTPTFEALAHLPQRFEFLSLGPAFKTAFDAEQLIKKLLSLLQGLNSFVPLLQRLKQLLVFFGEFAIVFSEQFDRTSLALD